MNNLDDANEIVGLHFDFDNPHVAITHKSQGYSANMITDALFTKSNGQVTMSEELIKSLDGVGEDTIQKMLYSNKRSVLEDLIREAAREGTGEDYVDLWILDMNDSLAAFRYENANYAVKYEMVGETLKLLGDYKKVDHGDIYRDSESGEVLIKATDWLSGNNPESNLADGESKEGDSLIETPEEDGKEEIMPEEKSNVEVEAEVEEVMYKASEVNAQILKAVKEARAEEKAEAEQTIAKAKLTDDTSAIVKGFGFIEEESVDELVKCLVANADLGALIFKSLDAANVAIQKANDEVVKVKEEFGKGTAIEDEVKDKEINKSADKGSARTQELQELVKAKLAAQNK